MNAGLHPLRVPDVGHADISKRDSALYMQIAATGNRVYDQIVVVDVVKRFSQTICGLQGGNISVVAKGRIQIILDISIQFM